MANPGGHPSSPSSMMQSSVQANPLDQTFDAPIREEVPMDDEEFEALVENNPSYWEYELERHQRMHEQSMAEMANANQINTLDPQLTCQSCLQTGSNCRCIGSSQSSNMSTDESSNSPSDQRHQQPGPISKRQSEEGQVGPNQKRIHVTDGLPCSF